MDATKAELRAENRALKAQIAALLARVAALEAEVAAARKHSGNSSKPPSSGIAKSSLRKRDKNKKNKRNRGGQLGHPRHERAAFAPEDVERVRDYTLSACPDCGGEFTPEAEPPRVVQQVEIVARPLEVTKHRGLPCFCNRCKKHRMLRCPTKSGGPV